MKASFLAVLSLLVASSSIAQLPVTEEEAVAYAKALDVKILDPSLPSQGLQEWLQNGPPHIETLRWQSDDTCDLHPDSSDSDYPRCVRIAFARGGQEGYFLVLIGSLKRGIIGPPQLYYGPDVVEPGFVQTGSTDRLSGLPHLLELPAVTGGVSDLYQKIVAQHPIGIPQGADKAALWPFLSRRLTQQLETAQACQDDYFRQQSAAGTISEPAWMTSDLFSGVDDRAAPFFVNVVHKEPLKEGFFTVQLDAVERDVTGKNSSIIAGGVRAYRVKKDRPIIATLVLQNERFVVDDIRIFEEDTTDGPSHVLSESFAGCDGPHWTGKLVEKNLVVAHVPPPIVDWNAVNLLRSTAYKEEVAFAKEVDVHQLDPSLPSQRLEDWLNSTNLHVNHIGWAAHQCNIKEGRDGATLNPKGGLCAGVWFHRGNARADIHVGKSISDPPKVKYIGVRDKDEGLLMPLGGTGDPVSDSDRLSNLPRLLNEESVIDVTRNLYDIVVAHHPLGIPQGPDRTRIRPLLSKRLNDQLATGQACQEDYLRQAPNRGASPRPVWPGAGLFSGEGKLALPNADLVDHKVREGDGSFVVLVWLSHKESGVPPSPTANATWKNWRADARVISEDGHFVVDDVKLFDGVAADSSSHSLSDFFSECDGPRWVGMGARDR
ncbi:MAG TPA: hypothetical protein VGL22_17430 [Terracidiphilus sp.]|jgi:hypothetical protein